MDTLGLETSLVATDGLLVENPTLLEVIMIGETVVLGVETLDTKGGISSFPVCDKPLPLNPDVTNFLEWSTSSSKISFETA